MDNRLNFARYNRLILTLIPRVLIQIHQWLYKGGSQSLSDYLDAKKMKRYDRAEKEIIKNGVELRDMDVKILYKLLQDTCGLAPNDSAWYTECQPGEELTLEKIIYKLKEFRNKLCHRKSEDNLKISDDILDETVTELKDLFSMALQQAGKKGKKKKADITKAIAKAKHDLDEERSAESCFTTSQFMQLARQELFDKESKVLSPLHWYLPPRLLAQDPEFTSDVQEVPSNDLFSFICREGSKREVFLLVGETGAGKTSFCQYVMRSWLLSPEELKNLKNYDLVFKLHCGQVNTRDLHYFLCTRLLPSTTRYCYDGAEITRIMSKLKVLWVVDGWDEATPEARDFVEELLMMQHDTHTVLVASRPERSWELLGQPFMHKKSIIYSFAALNAEERGKVLRRNMDHTIDEHDVGAILTFILNRELNNPLMLVLMARLWSGNKRKLKIHENLSVTHLYAEITKIQKSELKEKCKHEVSEECASDVVEKFFNSVCEVAFENVQNGPLLRVGNESIKSLKKTCGRVTPSVCLSTFFEFTKSSESSDVNDCYSFSQQSQRLYHAARHISHMCSGADDPDSMLFKIFLSYETYDDYIDPYLGEYDILFELIGLAGILLAKLSLGRLLPNMCNHDLRFTVQRLLKKSINLVKCSYYPTEEHKVPTMNAYYPLLVTILEMVTDNSFGASISNRKLVDLLSRASGADADVRKWSEVLQTGCFKEELVKEISSRINLDIWRLNDMNLQAGYELLQYVVPNEVIIGISHEPRHIPYLLEILYRLKENAVTVSLSFWWDFAAISMESNSDIYLSTLCNGEPKCKLKSFQGHLTVATMEFLGISSHLQTLTVRVTKKNALDLLVAAAQHCKSLEKLVILYDRDKFYETTKSLDGSLGILRFVDGTKIVQILQGSKRFTVDLFLPHLKDDTVKGAVDFISKLSKAYRILDVGNLGCKGVRALITGLDNNAVAVGNLMKRMYIRHDRTYQLINFGSLPLQGSLTKFATMWNNVQKGHRLT